MRLELQSSALSRAFANHNLLATVALQKYKFRSYHVIAENFHMVQNFAVFVDSSVATKKKTAVTVKFFNIAL